MKIKLSLLLILIIICSCATLEKDYQNDADKIRIQHLRYYGDLIQEYYEISGTFPFQGKIDIPIYITIANNFQKKNADQQLPFDNMQIPSTEFKQELERVLEREISLMYDPQKVGVYAPNFYIYSIWEGIFYFSIHLYNKYNFTKNVSKHYNKVELTNNSDLYPGQIHYDKLRFISQKDIEKIDKNEIQFHSEMPDENLFQHDNNGLNKNQNTQIDEIFINYIPESQYIRIKEHKLSTTEDNQANIIEQIAALKEEIKSTRYIKNRYRFDYWESLEEKLYKENQIVTSECDLLTKEDDKKEILHDCFSKILNRPVRIRITNNLTSLCFMGKDIKIGPSNGQVFLKEDVTLIFWDNLLNNFEIVIQNLNMINNELSLFEYFGEDIESPRISEEEIEVWRDK